MAAPSSKAWRIEARVPGDSQLAQVDFLNRSVFEQAVREGVGVGDKVSGHIGVVRHQDHRCSGEPGVAGLVGDDLLHHGLGFGERCRGQSPNGEIGQDVLTVHRGVGRIGGGP